MRRRANLPESSFQRRSACFLQGQKVCLTPRVMGWDGMGCDVTRARTLSAHARGVNAPGTGAHERAC